MVIHDIYILGESDSFEIKTNEEITVNMELEKTPPCYHTLLTGKVFNKESSIRNATVMVMDDNYVPLLSTITDETGIYKFSNILKPGKYKVVASAIGYRTSEIKTVYINQNEISKLSFILKKSEMFVNGIVYGKILEAGSRKPIEDADLYLKSYEDDDQTIYKTKSNQSGQYLLYNIMAGKYKMIVQKKGYITTEPVILEIEKHNRIILYFDLIRKSEDYNNTISGTVIHDKRPIPRVAVFLYRLDKQETEKIIQIQETNDNGLFLFSNVESGSYVVKGKMQNNVIYEHAFTINNN